MAFNWGEYLTFAKNLYEKQDIDGITCSREAVDRCIVSRAYYAAFHHAKKYAEMYGYRNIQELANESIREKVFEDNEFDETFNEEEIELIDSLIRDIIQNKNFGTKEELDKILKNEL